MWLLVFVSNKFYTHGLINVLHAYRRPNCFGTALKYYFILIFFFYRDTLPQIYPEEILLQHHTGTVEINILIGRVTWGPASKVSNL